VLVVVSRVAAAAPPPVAVESLAAGGGLLRVTCVAAMLSFLLCTQHKMLPGRAPRLAPFGLSLFSAGSAGTAACERTHARRLLVFGQQAACSNITPSCTTIT
jgi:hypothetical protein